MKDWLARARERVQGIVAHGQVDPVGQHVESGGPEGAQQAERVPGAEFETDDFPQRHPATMTKQPSDSGRFKGFFKGFQGCLRFFQGF